MTNQYVIVLSDVGTIEIGKLVGQWLVESKYGTYFKCNNVEARANYVHFEIDDICDDEQKIKYEVDIPHQYVKLIITGSDVNKIGFL